MSKFIGCSIHMKQQLKLRVYFIIIRFCLCGQMKNSIFSAIADFCLEKNFLHNYDNWDFHKLNPQPSV